MSRESPRAQVFKHADLTIDRRNLLGISSFAVAALTSPSWALSQTGTTDPGEETKTLDQLYEEAVAAGGKFILYAGGDHAAQADAVKNAFIQRLPKLQPTFVVDYSKYHDVRVDNQFATNRLVPDVVQMQTLQNFPRWKREGRLLNYKPAGFANVHEKFKDSDGAWLAIAVIAFSFMTEAGLADAPKAPKDLADPKWKGRLQSTYPHDDDAALYLYKLYVETYGLDWLAQMAAQDIAFARGSHTPAVAVNARQKPIGIGGSGSLLAPPSVVARWQVADGHPFMAWGQRAAILKDAKNMAAAKLYLNWSLSPERQSAAFNGWSVRTDIKPNGGLKPVWAYANSNVDGFPAFMADRELVERWRQTMALYFGEVKGDPSPGWLGLYPA